MKTIRNILIITILIPVLGFAQGLFPSEELTISVSPEDPRAGETVSLQVFSNTPGLDDSLISWSRDSVLERRGIGETTHQTKAGALGQIHTITVTVQGDSFKQKSIDIRPAEVSLIWEADSYTPPFYKGKALAGHQSAIRVIAIPDLINTNGVRLNEKDLFYEWQLEGKVDQSQSGLGRNVFEFRGSLISRPKTVSLFVRSGGGSISARESVTVNFVDPEILFYRESPLTGLRGEASLIEGRVNETESTFILEPYFFSKDVFENRELEYKWTVNGKRLENLRNLREITFDGSTPGRSSVFVEISNPFGLLQTAKSLFRVVVNGEN